MTCCEKSVILSKKSSLIDSLIIYLITPLITPLITGVCKQRKFGSFEM